MRDASGIDEPPSDREIGSHAPPSSAGPAPRSRRTITVRVATIAIIVAWVACLVGCAIMWIEIESVLATGPVVLFTGVLALLFGAFGRFRLAVLIGAAHVGVVLLFVGLVNLFAWGPAEAERPFRVMGLLFLVAMTPLTWGAWRTRPSAFAPWQCQSCGYALHGLDGTCCPECGCAFDVDAVIAATPADRKAAPGTPA